MRNPAIAALMVVLCSCATASRPEAAGDAKGDGKTIQIDAAKQIDANLCATQPCDILTQCGCTTTQACDVNVMTLMGTACRNVSMMGHETSTCGGLADCDRGFVCLGPQGKSACKKYCSTNNDCGTPRGQCVIDITNGTTPIAGLPPVCSSNCDPMNGAVGCPAAFKCGLFTQTHMGTMYNIVDCTPSGAGVQGTNCKVAATPDESLCAANFLCTTLDNVAYACRKICKKTAPTGCVGAQACLGYTTPFIIAGTEYGVCN
jgi:hypothetical protein